MDFNNGGDPDDRHDNEQDSASKAHIHSGLQRAAVIMTAYSAFDPAIDTATPANTVLRTADLTVHIEHAGPPEQSAKHPAEPIAPKQTGTPKNNDRSITNEEWREMLAAVRHLPHNRGTILLMLFRQCIGRTSFNVSIQTLRATKKERVKSVQDVESLLAEINQQLRNRKKTPFLLYRQPAYGPLTGYTLERRLLASSKRDRGRRTREEIEADRRAAGLSVETGTETTADSIDTAKPKSSAPLSIHPDHSDLSADQWSELGRLLAEHAEDWNWHPLLNYVFEARPNPVPLVELDVIAKGCGNSYQYAWGTAIVRVNVWLQKNGLPYRIMRKPSERTVGWKKKQNVYAGNVTLYLISQPCAQS